MGLLAPLGHRGRAIVLGLGAVQLFTGLSRYCPMNQALGINTCEPTTQLKHEIEELA